MEKNGIPDGGTPGPGRTGASFLCPDGFGVVLHRRISEARFDVQKNAKFFKQNIFLFYLEKNFTKGYNGLD